jgi:hypothetical protein
MSGDYNTSIILPSSGFTAPVGKHLTGWRHDSVDGTLYGLGSSYTIPSQDTVFYANWSANSYRLHFNANGGSGSMSEQVVEYDTHTPIADCAFT